MSLESIPLVFVLVGLALYIVLAGADFGAAIWQVTAPRSPQGRNVRDFAHNVMAPVWEANHVWLIFVLTVTWTAYPAAFGSIASTLSIALIVEHVIEAIGPSRREATANGLRQQLGEQLAAAPIGQCAHGMAVEVQHVEGDEGRGRAWAGQRGCASATAREPST